MTQEIIRKYPDNFRAFHLHDKSIPTAREIALHRIGDSKVSKYFDVHGRTSNDNKSSWDIGLNARDMILTGHRSGDFLTTFRFDHDYDLTRIVWDNLMPDGSVSLGDGEVQTLMKYNESPGEEFVFIKRGLVVPKREYGIRRSNYADIGVKLEDGSLTESELKEAGGFLLNEQLRPEDIPEHDGFLELFVGKNRASGDAYQEARNLLADEYIPRAIKEGCFEDGLGMKFFMRLQHNYTAKHCSIGGSDEAGEVCCHRGFPAGGYYLLDATDYELQKEIRPQ